MRFAAAFAALVVAAPAFAQTPAEPPRLITVTGEATVAAVPDAAVLRGGVTSQGKTAAEASAANNRDMNAVLTALRQAGVEENAIQTSRLSIYPRQENVSGQVRVVGFQATNQVTVKLRDTGRISATLDRMIAAGANDISGIDFIITEQSKALDEARRAAVLDARRKAAIYASAAGVQLGRAIAIQETDAPAVLMPRSTRAVAQSTPVSPGEETLRTSVTVSFELLR